MRLSFASRPGSTLVLSFLLPIELADPEVRPGIERAAEGGEQTARPSSAFSRRRRCSRSPVKLAFEMSSTYQRQLLPSATSPVGPMAFGRPTYVRSTTLLTV